MPPLVLIAALLAAPHAAAAAQTSVSPCVDEAARQFDFLVGDWTVTKTGDADPLAKVSVTRVADGCALLETLTPLKGISGAALFTYDADATLWRMTEVSGDGEIIQVQGGLQGGQMVLEGDETGTDKHELVRVSFEANGDALHESAVKSSDGRVWSDWFARDFRRASATPAPPAPRP
jgi:hypothetical protein